jgi:hypothetical protein
MEDLDYQNLVRNIIKFNENFNNFEDNVASILESKQNDNFNIDENKKMLTKAKTIIDLMIQNLQTR